MVTLDLKRDETSHPPASAGRRSVCAVPLDHGFASSFAAHSTFATSPQDARGEPDGSVVGQVLEHLAQLGRVEAAAEQLGHLVVSGGGVEDLRDRQHGRLE